MRALLFTLTTFSVLVFPLRGDAASLRCGNQLASEGASKSDVLVRCGEPAAKETRTERVGERTRDKDKQTGTTTTTEHVVYKTIDEWTYNFGPSRFMQTAVFENGRLVDVRSGGYGH
ncbi:DUF2845 domain-containing protein [Melittangium boletus]|uniref:DUF2845 domain-containing protein n=1 Tax=Melittangium boletus DSM 14713 TaxID=1294270 RepID=A0A286NVA8_9BACT|nr:DUF2845 domain-containing protein [Melittangium boletus]ATB27047.1 hypothetical protein MEBOL_000482 [Melittangium boletus DSM 14713]